MTIFVAGLGLDEASKQLACKFKQVHPVTIACLKGSTTLNFATRGPPVLPGSLPCLVVWFVPGTGSEGRVKWTFAIDIFNTF